MVETPNKFIETEFQFGVKKNRIGNNKQKIILTIDSLV